MLNRQHQGVAVVMQETEIEVSYFLGRSLVRESTVLHLLGEMGKHTGARQQHSLASGDLNNVLK